MLAERSPIIAWLNGKSVSDPRYPDVRWSYQIRDKRLVVDRTAGDRTESLVLEYALGSGKHGVTFVAIRGEEAGASPRASSTACRTSQTRPGSRLRPGRRETRGTGHRVTLPTSSRSDVRWAQTNSERALAAMRRWPRPSLPTDSRPRPFFPTYRVSDVTGPAASTLMQPGGAKPN